MAFRCPVCEALQPDGEHLANHLAITAMLGREDHATWLEEYAPGYADMGPAELATAVTPQVESVPIETDDKGQPDDENQGIPGAGPSAEPPLEHAIERQAGRGRTGPAPGGPDVDAETAAIIAEAREMTAAMSEECPEAVDSHAEETPSGENQTTDQDGPQGTTAGNDGQNPGADDPTDGGAS